MNTHRFVKPIMQGLTKLHTLLYNKYGGRFLGTLFGNPICMITTVGRKSGSLRTIPLLTIPYEDDYILVASSGGSPEHPAWYYNLIHEPRIKMTVNSKTFTAHARRLSFSSSDSCLAWAVNVFELTVILIHEPRIKMTVNSKTFTAHARQLSDEEKDSLWPFIIEACSFYEEYRQKTSRNIPVFICSPIS